MKLHHITAAALLALSAGVATAAPIVLSNGGTNYLGVTDNGSSHTDQGITGRGVTGEISLKETLVMNLNGTYTIKSFQLGLLYDGPEFHDVNEVAKVSFFGASGLIGSFTLTATDAMSASWTGAGSAINLSPAAQPGSGHWLVDGLHIADVTKIKFSALEGMCGTAGGKCTNQSDFIVTNVTAVPEPGTYAMFAAGLGALAFVARRRQRRD